MDQDYQIPDLSDAQTPSSKLLDKAGDFTAEVIKGKPGLSAQMGSIHKFQLEITDGPSKGKIITLVQSLQEQALWKYRDFVSACGKSIGQVSNCTDLVGSKLMIRTAFDLYQGDLRLRITKFSALKSADSEVSVGEREDIVG